jgi:hypothetical protein
MSKKLLKEVLIRVFVILIADFVLASLKACLSETNLNSVLTNFWNIIIVIGLVIVIIIIIICQKPYGYDNEKRKADKKLFNKIRKDLNGDIYFIREHNFRGSFNTKNLQKLYAFEDIKNDPNYKFLNPKIEKIKNELVKNVIRFKDIALTKTFSLHPNIVQVPTEWADTKPEIYNTVIQNLHTTANNICKCYDKFVLKGKTWLKV